MDENDRHFMDHPEVREVFAATNDFLKESDRGAVLLAAEIVGAKLERLFIAVAPPSLSNRERNRSLKYPGPLSSLSAKVDVAVMCQLISPHLGKAIHHLRDLRNKAAHSWGSFSLRDQWDKVQQAFDLGDHVPAAINRMALEILMKSLVGRLLEVKMPDDKKVPVFQSPGEVVDYLHNNPNLTAGVENQVPRMELAIAVAMVSALIIISYDRHRSQQDDD